MPIQKLLFVDTNIWLDFYRGRTDVSLSLLQHLESIKDKLIITYQLEAEFKKNRQAAIYEGLKSLTDIPDISRLPIFSDANDTKALQKSIKEANKRIAKLKGKLIKALEKPATSDPIYKACQRIFHTTSPHILDRDNTTRHTIRRRAYKRFLHGCPPRKSNDTSIGDAFNWEWMVACATQNDAELVIVSRDADYGLSYKDNAYINDHLRHEFSDRVSRKRKLLLYTKLSTALREHFAVTVTPTEVAAEEEAISAGQSRRTAEDAPMTPQSSPSPLVRALTGGVFD